MNGVLIRREDLDTRRDRRVIHIQERPREDTA